MMDEDSVALDSEVERLRIENAQLRTRLGELEQSDRVFRQLEWLLQFDDHQCFGAPKDESYSGQNYGDLVQLNTKRTIADSVGLELLQNVLSNAIKYRAECDPVIYVSCKSDGGEWTISIRDNGIGIAEKDQRRIFEIFRRLHSYSEYPGTGIGLAVWERIVQRHDGKIWD